MNKQLMLTNIKSSVQMAIFEHTQKDDPTWRSTTIKRPYQDRNGQCQHGSFRQEQLEAIVDFVQQAIHFIAEREQTKKSSRKSKAAR